MKKLMQGAWLLVAVGVLASCAETPDVKDSDTLGGPQAGEAQAVDIPEGALVIEDTSNGRFLISRSDASRPYVLGLGVSCEGGAAVREGSRIRCQGAASPQQTHLYIPLEGAASQQADSSILRSAAVTLTPLTEKGSVQCRGAPSADFQLLMERFAQDVGATAFQARESSVAVLLEYQGNRAFGAAPAEALGLGDRQLKTAYVEPIADEGGVTCSCNSGGSSCPKGGKLGASWCDASNCQSCTMSY
jgi:hypothetical protein